MKRFLAALLMVAGFAVSAAAQISIPNTFVPNTRIVSADVNENFTELGDKSLNREGGAATGDIVFATKIVPDTDGGADIGTAALRFGTVYVTNIDIGADIVANTILLEATSAVSIQTLGGITAGTDEVGIINTTGRIPEISTGYFTSVNGGNLTNLLETAITDGALLARVADAETITGFWTFQGVSPGFNINETGGAANEGNWTIVADAGLLQIQTKNDALALVDTPFYIGRNGGDADVLNVVVDSTNISGTTFNVSVSGNANIVATNAVPFTTSAVTNTGYWGSGGTQPGFFAHQSATGTTYNSGEDIVFSAEVYDTGADFNTGTGAFVAPVTGIYHLCTNVNYVLSGSDIANFTFLQNATTVLARFRFDNITPVENVAVMCAYVSLTAADSITVRYTAPGLETALVSAAARDTFFTGRLVP